MKHNIINYSKRHRSSTMPSKQSGFALLGIVLMLMIVVGLLSMTSARNTVLETKMVFNLQDKQRSYIAADSAAIYGWQDVKDNFDIIKVINNAPEAGFYVLGNKIPTTAKSSNEWDANKNVVSWPWEDNAKRFKIPAQLGGTSNPMQLQVIPQYTIGMHNSMPRKGTSDYHCIPISIIGASQGGTTQTRTLIELKTVPKNTCFHEKIK